LGVLERIAEWFYKRVGLKGVIVSIAVFFWFFFPFLLWFQIYQWVGQDYFVLNWALLGLAFFILLVITVCYDFVRMRSFAKGLKKQLDKANSLYSDPTNPEIELQVRNGCRKVFAPYLHIPFLYSLGLDSIYSNSGTSTKITMRAFLGIFVIYLDYSVLTLFIMNRENIVQVINFLSPYLYTIPFSKETAGLAATNLLATVIVFLIIAVLYAVYRRSGTRGKPLQKAWDLTFQVFSGTHRLHALGIRVFAAPFDLIDRDYIAKYDNFTLTQDAPLLIEKAVEDVQVCDCKVIKWSNDINTLEDIKFLKKSIVEATNLPRAIKDYCLKASNSKALEHIKKQKVTVFCGIANGKCEVWGKVQFNEKKKCCRARFDFDGAKTKEYFDSILKINSGGF